MLNINNGGIESKFIGELLLLLFSYKSIHTQNLNNHLIIVYNIRILKFHLKCQYSLKIFLHLFFPPLQLLT